MKTVSGEYSSLHLAIRNGHYACAKMLLEAGANVNALSAKKQTPLHMAAKSAFLDGVELLLGYGAVVNAQDEDGKTPLLAAVSRTPDPAQIHVVRCHVDDWQANVQVADNFGYTALHLAAFNELDECVDHLILRGANVTAKTKGKVSALKMMARKTPNSTARIIERLDKCLAFTEEQRLKFNFRDIVRHSKVGELGYLHALQKDGEAEMLKHPLCRAFLHLKWQKVKTFVLLRVALTVVVITLLSLFIWWGITEPACYKELAVKFWVCGDQYGRHHGPAVQCWNATTSSEFDFSVCSPRLCENYHLNLATLSELPRLSCDLNSRSGSDFVEKHILKLRWTWGIVVVAIIANTLRLLFSVVAHKSLKHFCVRYNNIVEAVVTVCLPLTLLYMCDMKTTTQQASNFLQKSVAGLTVLSSWTYVLIVISQLPSAIIYVTMFANVMKEFLGMMVAYLCLLVGFTFAFCTLEPGIFDQPVLSSIKVMVAMMTGELYDLESSNSFRWYRSVLVYAYIVVFTLLMTVMLSNLSIAVAVGDIDGLRQNAHLCQLVQQTKLIHFLEKACVKECYFPACMRNALRRLFYCFPDSYAMVLYVRPLSPLEKRLPRDVMEAALKIALDRLKRERESLNRMSIMKLRKEGTVEERVFKLEQMVRRLQENVEGAVIRLEQNANNTKCAGPKPESRTE
jgi:hypothetical protein